MSSIPGPAMEFLGRVAFTLHKMKPLIPTYIHLLLSAIFPIYTAAHASLARPSSAAPSRKRENIDVTDLQDEEISPTIEALSPSDAILLPILAGATLTSLYFILKWLQDPALLNYYLGLYLAFAGLWFNIKFVGNGLATVRSMILPNQYSYKGKLWKLTPIKRRFEDASVVDGDRFRSSPLPGKFSILFQTRNSVIWNLRQLSYTKFQLKCSIWKLINITTVIDVLDLVAVTVTLPIVYYHTFVGRPWFLTNFLGFAFCYSSLQLTTPATSMTGSLLLMALFFYDVYMVFFTPMMIEVATKLDVPIKLLFPRPDACIKPVGAAKGSEEMVKYLECKAKVKTMAMLGLGDIIIPGMMLAFALRFDLYLYYRKLAASRNTEPSSDVEGREEDKIPYLPATGSWGERFWTSSKLWSPELQAKRFPKTYFIASTVGYVIGMIVTIVVMQVTNHGQPALLYLVPGVLSALWGVAIFKGDLKALWQYNEGEDESKKQEVSKTDEQKNNEKLKDKNDEKVDTDGGAKAKSTDGDNKQPDNEDAQATSKKNKSDSPASDYLIFFALSKIKPTTPTSTKTEIKLTNTSETPNTTSAHDIATTSVTEDVSNTSSQSIVSTPSSTDSWPSSSSDENENDDKNKTAQHNRKHVDDNDNISHDLESINSSEDQSHELVRKPKISYPGTVKVGGSTAGDNEPATKRRRKA